jgi:hypothetical protein
VDYQSDFVEMRYDADQVSIDTIMDELEEIGYRPASYRDASEES